VHATAASAVVGRVPGDIDITFVGLLLGHGGDALQMLDLAVGMQRRGARTEIIVPEVAESVEFARRAAEAGVACRRSPLIRASMQGPHQSWTSMIRLLRSIDSPVVHFHTGNSLLPRALLVALETLRYRKSFVTVQSPYETVSPGSLRARFWAATAPRRFHAVVSPSDHGRRFQLRAGVPASTACTIRNSVDIARWARGDPRGPRDRLGVASEDPLVVFSSRLDPQKRPLDALAAFAGAIEPFPSAQLVFVGEGALRAEVESEAARLGLGDRVHLVGYQHDVENWLAAATVWILPTERENFSLAVLEALAAGRAVLSTDCPGNDEVLVDGVNASVFAVGDVADATVRLRRLLGDASLRRELGDAGVATASQFTSDHMAQEYEHLYRTWGADW
jgi:glycosyltransferase involved in cell wall biosynthesis